MLSNAALADFTIENPDIDETEVSNRKLNFANGSYGNTSAALSQFKVYNDRNFFVGREENSLGSDVFSLAIYEMTGSSSVTLTKEKTLLNTKVTQLIHGNNFNVTTAYDPYIEWHQGEYWVAFECHGPAFNTKATQMGFTSSSVGICMGPLNSQKDLILSRTRVMVAGGGLGNHTHSASVPKLLSYKGELYLYWTSVTKNSNAPHVQRRADAADYYKYLTRVENTVEHTNYKIIANDIENRVEPISWTDYKNGNPSGSSCRPLSGKQGCFEKDDFLEYQKNILNAYSPYNRWKTNGDSVVRDGYGKPNPNDPNIIDDNSEILKFEKLRSFGAKLVKQANYYIIKRLGSSPIRIYDIPRAMDHNEFTEILPLTDKITEPESSIVSDMFEIKRFGEDLIYIFALGGIDNSEPGYENFYCTSGAVGVSNEGCYRFQVFKSSNPLGQLDHSFDHSVNDNLIFPGGLRPAVSYPRFFVHPTNDKTMISANITKSNPAAGQYGRVLELTTESFSLEGDHIPNKLEEGSFLNLGDILLSKNGNFWLSVEETMVIVRGLNGKTKLIFQTQTNQPFSSFKLQPDGNIVATRPGYSTLGKGVRPQDTYLILQNDGNLVQYPSAGGPHLWSSGIPQ